MTLPSGENIGETHQKRSFRFRQYKFVLHGDLDGMCAALAYQFLHGIPEEDIRWVVVSAGRRLGPDFPGQIVFHFDTGGVFDGTHNFDHHQGGESVRGECATSLVWRSLPDRDERQDAVVFTDFVDYARISDTGVQPFGARLGWPPSLIKNIYGMQAVLDRGIPLHNIERKRICQVHFFAWHHAALRDIKFMEELLKGELLHLLMIPSVGAMAAVGNTNHDSSVLRNLFKGLVNPKFRSSLDAKPGYLVDFLVCRYLKDTNTGRNKIGITNVLNGRWPRLHLWDVAHKVHQLYPHVPPPPPKELLEEIRTLEESRNAMKERGGDTAEFDLHISERKAAMGPVYVDHRNFVVYWYLAEDQLTTDMILRALVYVLRESRDEERAEFLPPINEFDVDNDEDNDPVSRTVDVQAALAKLREIQGRVKAPKS